MNDNLAKQKYEELKMLDEQIQEYQKYIQELDHQIGTLNEVINWTKELQDVKEGSETFIPVANGIFVKGTITNAKELFVNIGEKTIVKKNPENTVKMLEGQIGTITKMRDQTVQEFHKTVEQAQSIEQEVHQMMQKEQ